jgi:hypothetical protein
MANDKERMDHQRSTICHQPSTISHDAVPYTTLRPLTSRTRNNTMAMTSST